MGFCVCLLKITTAAASDPCPLEVPPCPVEGRPHIPRGCRGTIPDLFSTEEKFKGSVTRQLDIHQDTNHTEAGTLYIHTHRGHSSFFLKKKKKKRTELNGSQMRTTTSNLKNIFFHLFGIEARLRHSWRTKLGSHKALSSLLMYYFP